MLLLLPLLEGWEKRTAPRPGLSLEEEGGGGKSRDFRGEVVKFTMQG
jgi:hypothetical protein